ncbi:riboflavin synthase [Brackiella oedipodis]|uniref:riboflavin synthase n=1 Tax=Brackiella oedipodis TaxID=124225 RepID=UPI00048F9546|nr:riboflavin synthase [Brackiella oedipodis]
MFTGIITAIGQIDQVTPLGTDHKSGVRLRIQAPNFDLSTTKIGDSIAIQGACMTVVQLHAAGFEVEVSRESLNKTTGLDKPGPVNLEPAMRLGDTLDGHLVAGHVDGLGQVLAINHVGESTQLRVQVPAELAKYLAYKGSIVINGVSLTVNAVADNSKGCEISINLIAHTLKATTLQFLQQGQAVNLEIDLIARYVERMLQYRA